MTPTLLIVDPGHGGSDPGQTSGPPVVCQEKSIVFTVAKQFPRILANTDQVRLTRDTDVSLTEADRVQAANRYVAQHQGPALLVSIHLAADSSPETRGFRVIGSPSAPDELLESFSTALEEVYRKEGMADPTSFVAEARRASLPIFSGLQCVGVLIEFAFITHPVSARAAARSGPYWPTRLARPASNWLARQAAAGTQPRHPVRGRLVNIYTHRPAPNVTVQADGGGMRLKTTSGADGTFELRLCAGPALFQLIEPRGIFLSFLTGNMSHEVVAGANELGDLWVTEKKQYIMATVHGADTNQPIPVLQCEASRDGRDLDAPMTVKNGYLAMQAPGGTIVLTLTDPSGQYQRLEQVVDHTIDAPTRLGVITMNRA